MSVVVHLSLPRQLMMQIQSQEFLCLATLISISVNHRIKKCLRIKATSSQWFIITHCTSGFREKPWPCLKPIHEETYSSFTQVKWKTINLALCHVHIWCKEMKPQRRDCRKVDFNIGLVYMYIILVKPNERKTRRKMKNIYR